MIENICIFTTCVWYGMEGGKNVEGLRVNYYYILLYYNSVT